MDWLERACVEQQKSTKEPVDNIALCSAATTLKAEGLSPEEVSVVDHVVTKASNQPLTVGQLRGMNPELAAIYESQI
jgi:hypothetical protein